jgi:hypothetical protein
MCDRIGDRPGPHRDFQSAGVRERTSEQRFEPIAGHVFKVGDDPFERHDPPSVQDGVMKRVEVGEMPIEAAPRDPYRLCQGIGLERCEARCL